MMTRPAGIPEARSATHAGSTGTVRFFAFCLHHLSIRCFAMGLGPLL